MEKYLADMIREEKLEFCRKESKLTGRNAKEIEQEIDAAIRKMDSSNNTYAKYIGFQEGKTEIEDKKEFGILPSPPGYFVVNPAKIENYLQGYLMATGDKERVKEIRAEAMRKIVNCNGILYWGNASCSRHCIYE